LALLAALTGAFAPTEGHIRLDGKDVTGTSAEVMCHHGIVRTHQIPRPFGGLTVFENARLAASFGRLDHSGADHTAYEALKLCRLLPLANKQAGALGLLDRKRLEMARAMATEPRVVLLDEVGGGLTEAEAEILVEIIREIHASGCAIVWIEHIVHVLLQVSKRLICMDMGRVIADGEPNAVMRDPTVMKAYLGQVAE
jgi:branched-chain amino acid transport system ATP-binding protein